MALARNLDYIEACTELVDSDDEIRASSIAFGQLLVCLLRTTFERLSSVKGLLGEGVNAETLTVKSIELGHYLHKKFAIEPQRVIGILRHKSAYFDVVQEKRSSIPSSKDEDQVIGVFQRLGLEDEIPWKNGMQFLEDLAEFRKTEVDCRRVSAAYAPEQWGVVDFVTRLLVTSSGPILLQTKNSMLANNELLALLVKTITSHDVMPRVEWYYRRDFTIHRTIAEGEEAHGKLSDLYALNDEDLALRLELKDGLPAADIEWLGQMPEQFPGDANVRRIVTVASELSDLFDANADMSVETKQMFKASVTKLRSDLDAADAPKAKRPKPDAC